MWPEVRTHVFRGERKKYQKSRAGPKTKLSAAATLFAFMKESGDAKQIISQHGRGN